MMRGPTPRILSNMIHFIDSLKVKEKKHLTKGTFNPQKGIEVIHFFHKPSENFLYSENGVRRRLQKFLVKKFKKQINAIVKPIHFLSFHSESLTTQVVLINM